jgi:hypothetical protein
MKLHLISGVSRKLVFLSVCLMGGAVVGFAQSVTLRPVDTGRSVVTFDLGGRTSEDHGRVAIKTNLLYAGATLTPNLALEFATGGRTSIELAAGYNNWGYLWDEAATGPEWDIVNNYKTKLNHIYGRAALRYWFRDRFAGHFAGAGLFYGDYNVGDLDVPLLFEREFDYDGNAFGASISYGYLWRWSRRWAMEFNLGAGVAIMKYRKSFIEGNTESYELKNEIDFRKTYLGPTEAGIKLVFTIK